MQPLLVPKVLPLEDVIEATILNKKTKCEGNTKMNCILKTEGQGCIYLDFVYHLY